MPKVISMTTDSQDNTLCVFDDGSMRWQNASGQWGDPFYPPGCEPTPDPKRAAAIERLRSYLIDEAERRQDGFEPGEEYMDEAGQALADLETIIAPK